MAVVVATTRVVAKVLVVDEVDDSKSSDDSYVAWISGWLAADG